MEDFPEAGTREDQQTDRRRRIWIDQSPTIFGFWRVLGVRALFIDFERESFGSALANASPSRLNSSDKRKRSFAVSGFRTTAFAGFDSR